MNPIALNKSISFILVCLLLCVGGCSKETTRTQSGSLIVTVKDVSGIFVPEALVVIGPHNGIFLPIQPPDIPQLGITDLNGIIEFPEVILGEHLVAVDADGFKAYEVLLQIMANRTTNHTAIITPDSTGIWN